MSPAPRRDLPEQTPADSSAIPPDGTFTQRTSFAGPAPDYEELRKILERDCGRKFTYEEARRFGIFLMRLTKALD